MFRRLMSFIFRSKTKCTGLSCGVIDNSERVINTKGHPVLEYVSCVGTDKEVWICNLAIQIANTALASKEFNSDLMKDPMTSTNGLTNQGVFEKISQFVMPVRVKFFDGSWMQRRWGTVGLDKGDGVVYANRYFVQDEKVLASLICHEALGHQNGFSHTSSKELTSVPYRLNRAVEACLNEGKK